MTAREITSSDDFEMISSVIPEECTGIRRITMVVSRRDNRLYASFILHPRDKDLAQMKNEPDRRMAQQIIDEMIHDPSTVFFLTQDMYSQELNFMKRHVREEADRRGLGYIRGLGF